MRNYLILLIVSIACSISIVSSADAQQKPAKFGKICGNPKVRCRSGDLTFQAHELGFEIPNNNAIIFDSESFYAIILKAVKLDSKTNCENAVSETE